MTSDPARRLSRFAEASRSPVVDTTELRWFEDGPLPRAVHRWFSGATEPSDIRRDRYLLDAGDDLGVKLRNGETLELKSRVGLAGPGHTCGGLTGELEVWRKWVLIDGLEPGMTALRWTDVDKTIFKRRFSLTGCELPFTPELPDESGCDAEIVVVQLDETSAWSFAFAAFGPAQRRCAAIGAGWNALLLAGPPPSELRLEPSCCMGYPQWLRRMTGQASAQR